MADSETLDSSKLSTHTNFEKSSHQLVRRITSDLGHNPQVIFSALYRWPPSKLYPKSNSFSSQSRIPGFSRPRSLMSRFFVLFTDRDRHVFWTFCGMSRGLCTSPKADYTTQSIYGLYPAIITAICRSRCHAPPHRRSCAFRDMFGDISHRYDRAVAALH
jgi:hypothetical protein